MITSFAMGTTMLAKNTKSAIGHISASIRCITPLRIVSGEPSPNEITVMTGNTLAGMYRINAVSVSAHVRLTLLGLRKCRVVPQRGQWGRK